MMLRFVVSHPFRKEREMDGARRVFGVKSFCSIREKSNRRSFDSLCSLRMTEFLRMTVFCL
jgi:hypothetical protein